MRSPPSPSPFSSAGRCPPLTSTAAIPEAYSSAAVRPASASVSTGCPLSAAASGVLGVASVARRRSATSGSSGPCHSAPPLEAARTGSTTTAPAKPSSPRSDRRGDRRVWDHPDLHGARRGRPQSPADSLLDRTGRARLDRSHTATALLGPGCPHPSHRRPELGRCKEISSQPSRTAGIDAADRQNDRADDDRADDDRMDDDRTCVAVAAGQGASMPFSMRSSTRLRICDEFMTPVSWTRSKNPRCQRQLAHTHPSEGARKKARRGSSSPPADSVR